MSFSDFLCVSRSLVLAIKIWTLVPRHSWNKTTSKWKRSGKGVEDAYGGYGGEPQALRRVGTQKKIRQTNSTSRGSPRQPTTYHHFCPCPPYQDDAFAGLFLCAVCGSCWDSWTKSTRNQCYRTLTRDTETGLLIRIWHNVGETSVRNGRIGNISAFFNPLPLQYPPG